MAFSNGPIVAMSGAIFMLLLRTFIVSQLPIVSAVLVWALMECSGKKLELTPAEPIVKGPKHLELDETQLSRSSQIKPLKVKASLKPSKISFPKEENEPKPIAESLKCGRTQGSHTIPVLPSDDTTKHVESLPESSS